MARTRKTRAVKAVVPVATDVEMHVSEVTVAGVPLIDIRQFIPSTKTYGRGISFPAVSRDQLIEGLKQCTQ